MIIETRQDLIENIGYARLAMEARLKEGDTKGVQAAQEWLDKLLSLLAEHERQLRVRLAEVEHERPDR